MPRYCKPNRLWQQFMRNIIASIQASQDKRGLPDHSIVLSACWLSFDKSLVSWACFPDTKGLSHRERHSKALAPMHVERACHSPDLDFGLLSRPLADHACLAEIYWKPVLCQTSSSRKLQPGSCMQLQEVRKLGCITRARGRQVVEPRLSNKYRRACSCQARL